MEELFVYLNLRGLGRNKVRITLTTMGPHTEWVVDILGSDDEVLPLPPLGKGLTTDPDVAVAEALEAIAKRLRAPQNQGRLRGPGPRDGATVAEVVRAILTDPEPR